MKSKKKALVQDLLTTLAPHLSGLVSADKPAPKSLVKTVGHLAEQLLRLRARQEKRAAKATASAPREARQKLTDELAAVLDAHFAEDIQAEKATRLLTETADELAGKLTKLHSKKPRKQKKDSSLLEN